MAKVPRKKKRKKISNQLEFDFTLSSGKVRGVEFDFLNEEHNFFCQLYQNKNRLKVDLLRLSLVDQIKKSRQPVQRVLLFKNELTRKKVERENRSILKKYKIETTTITTLRK